MAKRKGSKPPNTGQGQWSWNNESFHDKYVQVNDEDCWIWTGSAGPHGALFGAYKNGSAQMTQARRISWMSHNKEHCEEYQFKMLCHNKMCVNPHHMLPKPNNRRK